jgi:uncharacterized membrane protein YciS (DUF1049 family)
MIKKFIVLLIVLYFGFNVINKVVYNYLISQNKFSECLLLHPYLSIKNKFRECDY